MLQAFSRHYQLVIIGKVFFTILLLTFALLGVGYGFRDLLLGATSNNDAATVGGKTISLNDLDRQYRRQLSKPAAPDRRPGFKPVDPAKAGGGRAPTLDQEVNDMLFAQQATHDGFRVGDALVRKIIESEPSFAGADKHFDQAHFPHAA